MLRRATLVAVACLMVCLDLCKSEASCADLGFTGEHLCSDCDSLQDFVKDADLVAECKRCNCVKDKEDKKYTSVALEVCSFKIQHMPEIKEFVDTRAKGIKSLKIRYASGANPKLKLKTSEGQTDTVRIDNWKASTILEFLKDKLAV